ncbi:MAG TPA: acyltransferase [Chthoniobacterales bacterium]
MGDYSFANIRVGDDVFIGPGAMFIAANTTIEIGNKVMFGPGVTILGGDHNTSVLGRFMYDVKEKRAGDDQPVIIEDDVWVGARAVILKGVRVGRGAIIAAGAVATKNVPPYSVTGGSPARVLKWRWTVDQIIAHEEQIYPVARRLSASELYAERSVE